MKMHPIFLTNVTNTIHILTVKRSNSPKNPEKVKHCYGQVYVTGTVRKKKGKKHRKA